MKKFKKIIVGAMLVMALVRLQPAVTMTIM